MKTINSKAGAAIGAGLLLAMALGVMPAAAVAEPADVDGATAETTAYTPDWSLIAPATFYDADGTFLAVRYYWKAQPLTIWQYYPAPRDGYTFEGWAIKGKEADGVVDPKSVPMSVDGMEFVAVWKPVVQYATATFLNDDGSLIGTAEYEVGKAMNEWKVLPGDREGSTFLGYAIQGKEADGVVDPQSVPMSVDGMTFVAAWQKDEVPVTMHTVTFVDRGSVVGTVEVPDGETVAKPADDPTFEGYDFHGWSINPEVYEAYDFSTPVTSDITLYSFYTPIEPAEPTDPTEPAEPTPEEPADKGADKVSDEKASDKEALPETGDPTSFAPIVGSGLAAVAAIASGIFLKRRNN